MVEHGGPQTPGRTEIAVPDAWTRAQAFFLDNLVLVVPCLLEWALIWWWLESLGNIGTALFGRDSGLFASMWMLFPLLLTLNLALLEMVTLGRTPGKKLSGLRVVSRGGGSITPRQAVTRNLLRFVDMLPAYYAVGLASMASDRLRRRVGDRVAGTVVVVDREDVLPFMRFPVKRVQ
jgi:uncharacterized RDD family membrane protein YckC